MPRKSRKCLLPLFVKSVTRLISDNNYRMISNYRFHIALKTVYDQYEPAGFPTFAQALGGMAMNSEIEKYNALQTPADQAICNTLMDAINSNLPTAERKIWHGSPVWFIDGNPIVGYSKLKSSIQLLFWSGASFEDDLQPIGKFKAAEARYSDVADINTQALTSWLQKSIEVQWDYKHIAQRQGVLERL